jgi:MoxR-like ATPase
MSGKLKIQNIQAHLNQSFYERASVINGMLVALLSRQMLFMLGPPGVGKSALCNALCKALGGNYFAWQVSKFTTPEELFGPVSFKAMESDQHVRVTTGKLPKADIAFVDEIFKGSSSILNTLLPIMNERTFFNGSEPEQIPLQVMFGASNELPDSEELAPMYDRFVLRYLVSELQDDASRKALLKSKIQASKPAALPTLSLSELKAEQDAVSQVGISDDTIDLIIKLWNEVRGQGQVVSDRKWAQIIAVLQAQAYLNGHSEVQPDDLEILENVLWRETDEIKKVRQVVAKYANPLGQEIMDITDGIRDVINSYRSKEIEDIEAHKKIKKGLEKLRSFRQPGVSNSKLDQAISQMEALNKKFMAEELGLI